MRHPAKMLLAIGSIVLSTMVAGTAHSSPGAIRPRVPGDKYSYLMTVPAFDGGMVLMRIGVDVTWTKLDGKWVLLQHTAYEYGGEKACFNYTDEYCFSPDGAQELLQKVEHKPGEAQPVTQRVKEFRPDLVVFEGGSSDQTAVAIDKPTERPEFGQALTALENCTGADEVRQSARQSAQVLRDGVADGRFIVRANRGMLEFFAPALGHTVATVGVQNFPPLGQQFVWFVLQDSSVTPADQPLQIKDPDGGVHSPSGRGITNPY